MVLKFRLISDEVKDFVRDIEILAEQTFYDLHSCIVENFHYDKSQLASFFLTNREWEKLQEFTLFDMSENGRSHTILMDRAVLKDYITDAKQRLLYVFDVFNERLIFLELTGMIKERGKEKYPQVTHSTGHPPRQIMLGSINFEGLNVDE